MKLDPFSVIIIFTMIVVVVVIVVLLATGAMDGKDCIVAGKTLICHDER